MSKEYDIRKDFYNRIGEFTDENSHNIDPYPMQRVADWWLDIIRDINEQHGIELLAWKKTAEDFEDKYEKIHAEKHELVGGIKVHFISLIKELQKVYKTKTQQKVLEDLIKKLE